MHYGDVRKRTVLPDNNFRNSYTKALMNATNDIVSPSAQENTEVGDVVGSDVMGSGVHLPAGWSLSTLPRRVFHTRRRSIMAVVVSGMDGLTHAGKK